MWVNTCLYEVFKKITTSSVPKELGVPISYFDLFSFLDSNIHLAVLSWIIEAFIKGNHTKFRILYLCFKEILAQTEISEL